MAIGSNVVTQITISVDDFDKAVENWAAVLGMEKPQTIHFPGPDKVPNFTNDELTDCSDIKIATFVLPNVRIELIKSGKNKNAFSEDVAKDGYGLHDLCFIVPDRHAANECLQGLGVPKPYHIGYWPKVTYAFVDSRKQLGVKLNIKTQGEDNAEHQKEVLADREAHKKDFE